MKRVLMLMPVVFAVGCSSSNPATTSSTKTTELAGTWNVSGTAKMGTSTATGTYQVKLVTSACSVTTPVGIFSVQGPVCFIANNDSGAGAISGMSSSMGQGILVGVASDPVPDNETIHMVFVSAANGGQLFDEITGTAAISGGTMTGSGACSPASTANCTGASATFTATHQ